MKSYETINELSEGLYHNIKNEADIKSRIEDAVQRIHLEISKDFSSLFGKELSLEGFHVYVDDESYRQSATGLILYETIFNHKEFKIRVECLIDHGRIWIKVKGGKDISDFTKIVSRIEKVQSIEGLSELREIK
ncbi:hypothetical protein [Winogradskyella pulchriflava]|uniref:Uncharacterized protein n=1 Tax=Winogradskyella pulchriflava TaxID=1110688 RepID=A0ABV6Q7V6_9FLAO